MYSTLYWLTRLNAIQGIFIAAAIVSLLALIIILIFVGDSITWDKYEDDEKVLEDRKNRRKKVYSYFRPALITCILTAIAAVLTPSKNDAILIFAGGKAYEYIQKDTSLQKIPFQTTEYLKLVLQQQIDEVKAEAKK